MSPNTSRKQGKYGEDWILKLSPIAMCPYCVAVVSSEGVVDLPRLYKLKGIGKDAAFRPKPFNVTWKTCSAHDQRIALEGS